MIPKILGYENVSITWVIFREREREREREIWTINNQGVKVLHRNKNWIRNLSKFYLANAVCKFNGIDGVPLSVPTFIACKYT